MWRGRPLWAEIDLDAIAHNIKEIQRRVGGNREILAVVKANGYGHGAVQVAKEALRSGARRLGVACADEGVQLRQAGITAPVLVMGYTPEWEAVKLIANDLTPTVTTRKLALALAAASSQKGRVTPVHIKIDTGMNRLGVSPGEAEELVSLIRSLPSLSAEGLYTHFASADELDKEFTYQQFKVFLQTAERLPAIPYRHAANSAAILDLPEMGLEIVRPGVSVYGCYPSNSVGRSVELRPALTLKSRVARLQWLAPGETVSYGRTWMAKERCRIALVSCGYADGLPRLLSNVGHMLVRGVRVPIVGRICMDQCIVDVTHVPGIELDDEVVIIGRQGEEEITAGDVAQEAQTISYEILCGISARVPRLYIKGGEVVACQTLVDEEEFSPSPIP
ncbi:MAG: alanine racemase [Dehalococcoidia bacterium]|nr:alanine racemase [Dehalococcoidia bacterium]